MTQPCREDPAGCAHGDRGVAWVGVARIAGAWHGVVPEQPEAVVRTVRDWARTIRQEL